MTSSKQNHSKKKFIILYWVFTILLLLPTAGSGIPELFTNGPEAVAASMQHLGYPLYLMKILGFAKILGAVAILTGRSKRIKEWAYAGFAFDFLGASASHAFVGDGVDVFIPMIFFGLLTGSYYFWTRIEKK